MALTHLLDTSVYSQPLKKRPDPNVVTRWKAVGDPACAISIICEAEVLFGIRKKGSARLASDYDALLRDRFVVLSIDSAVADAYANLRLICEIQGLTVADLDLLIAATAKAHGLIIATLNVRHFITIPGIQIEDWSKPVKDH